MARTFSAISRTFPLGFYAPRFSFWGATALALALTGYGCSGEQDGAGDDSDAADDGQTDDGVGGGDGDGTNASGGSSTGGDSGAGTGGEESEPTGPIFTTEGDGNFVIGPDYTVDPDVTDLGNPRGQQFTFTMSSADSELYKGDDVTLNDPKPFTRSITVYIPNAYQDGTEAPILVHHDGTWHFDQVTRALDNLTISEDPARKLPAFIAIAVNHGGGDSKGSQRGLEYDTMSDRYARFIELEVLPAVLNNPDIKAAFPNIKFTTDPWGKAAMGCSSGGAAALTMGWFRPDLFRRIVTYSGTFVDQQDDDAPEEAMYPRGAWEYHSEQELIKNSELKPLRIFQHVSENDLNFSPYHNWPLANERTATALQDKGYHNRFLFAENAGHCDDKVFNETVADTLVWIWQGYTAP